MKRISEIIITIIVLGVIVYAFQVKAERDRLILTGKEILLELAPVDPLSLLQGQYMIINFALEREEIEVKDQEVNSDRIRINHNESARIVLRYNESGVASFNRFEDGQLLASNEMLFNCVSSLYNFFTMKLSSLGFLKKSPCKKIERA